MSSFIDKQQKYYRDTMTSLPTKSKIDTAALNLALGDVDPLVPGNSRRVSETMGFFTNTDKEVALAQKDAACRAFPGPGPAMRDAAARTGCGWWFNPNVGETSIGAYGTRHGPMDPLIEKKIGKGEWIWNMDDAARRESTKVSGKVKSCQDLDIYKKQNPNLGWCASMNRAIVVDRYGRPAFPNSPGGFCPDDEKIIMSSTDPECKVPPPTETESGSASSASVAWLCTPTPTGQLTPQCLKVVSDIFCSPRGSLSAALSGGYAETSAEFNKTNEYLTQRGFALNNGIVKDGNISLWAAIQDVWGLRSYANPDTPNMSTAAAANLCWGTPFKPCDFRSDKPAPHDLRCIKEFALNMGYSSAGTLLQKDAAYWNKFPLWQDVVNHLSTHKQVADSGSETKEQVEAIRKVYGIGVIPPQKSVCSPNTFAGLQVWYDAADPNGNGSIPANGTPITTWVNKAGNSAYNANVAASFQPAIYSTSKRSLQFNGKNLYNTNYPAAPTAETIFMVFNNPSPDIFRRFLISSSWGSRSFDSGGTGIGGPNSVGFSAPGIEWQAATSKGSYASGTTAFATGVIAGGKTNVSINGGSMNSGPANYRSGTTVLGLYPSEPYDQAYRGDGMEIIIFNTALPNAIIHQIEGYLAWKWGIQSQLPLSHPFKNNAPSSDDAKGPTIMYGPWVGKDTPIMAIGKLKTNEMVYIIEHPPYTKLVTASGAAKYYGGKIDDFDPDNWNLYTDVGNNYKVR